MQFLTGKVGPTAWNVWDSLFHKNDGDHAVLIAGFATPRAFVTDELLVPIAEWMRHAPSRKISIFIGLTPKVGEERTKLAGGIAKVLGTLLGHLDEQARLRVQIHLVPHLHAKAYAIYEGDPLDFNVGESRCLKLLLGSSNLSLTAFTINLELDVYMARPADADCLDGAAAALKKLLLAVHFGRSEAERSLIPILDIPDSEVGAMSGVDVAFYNELTRCMWAVESDLAMTKVQETDEALQQHSDEILKEND